MNSQKLWLFPYDLHEIKSVKIFAWIRGSSGSLPPRQEAIGIWWWQGEGYSFGVEIVAIGRWPCSGRWPNVYVDNSANRIQRRERESVCLYRERHGVGRRTWKMLGMSERHWRGKWGWKWSYVFCIYCRLVWISQRINKKHFRKHIKGLIKINLIIMCRIEDKKVNWINALMLWLFNFTLHFLCNIFRLFCLWWSAFSVIVLRRLKNSFL